MPLLEGALAHLVCRHVRQLEGGDHEIVIGEVVRHTEPDFDLLECLNPETDQCVITNVCRLKSVLTEARDTFLDELDRYTLADLTTRSAQSAAFKSIPILHG